MNIYTISYVLDFCELLTCRVIHLKALNNIEHTSSIGGEVNIKIYIDVTIE